MVLLSLTQRNIPILEELCGKILRDRYYTSGPFKRSRQIIKKLLPRISGEQPLSIEISIALLSYYH